MLIGILLPLHSAAQGLVPPHPYGGEAGLRKFIQQELIYPEKALLEKQEGTVVLLFVVNEDGSTSNMRVWQSASEELDEEAKRLFHKVLWKPAQIGQVIQPSEHYFRVVFSVSKYNRYCKRRGFEAQPTPYLPVDSSSYIYDMKEVDQVPHMIFQDTSYSYRQFIIDNLKYPESAYKASIEGTVIISFVLEPSGLLTNFNIDKHVGGGCAVEAMRLLRLLDWYPSVHNGKAVRTKVQFAVHFRLPDSNSPHAFDADN